MLQGAGPHFSIGGNPHGSAQTTNLTPAVYARFNCHELYEGFVKLQAAVAVVGAVHGTLVGGGIAACTTRLPAAERSAIFEHGNLPRGVCPLGILSGSFANAVGPHGQHIYLQNHRSTAVQLEPGLAHMVCTGIPETKAHAVQLARRGSCSAALVMEARLARAPIDLIRLPREAVLHMDCLSTNKGMVKSTLSSFLDTPEWLQMQPVALPTAAPDDVPQLTWAVLSRPCNRQARARLPMRQTLRSAARAAPAPASGEWGALLLRKASWQTTTSSAVRWRPWWPCVTAQCTATACSSPSALPPSSSTTQSASARRSFDTDDSSCPLVAFAHRRLTRSWPATCLRERDCWRSGGPPPRCCRLRGRQRGALCRAATTRHSPGMTSATTVRATRAPTERAYGDPLLACNAASPSSAGDAAAPSRPRRRGDCRGTV